MSRIFQSFRMRDLLGVQSPIRDWTPRGLQSWDVGWLGCWDVAMPGGRPSQHPHIPTGLTTSHPRLLHHQTAVLHHLDARLGQLAGGFVVADAELEPDELRFGGEDVVDVR